MDYVESVCDEFRMLYDNVKGTTPYCVKTAAVLNIWGKMRAWGCHMVHHALYYKKNCSYAGVIEAPAGAPGVVNNTYQPQTTTVCIGDGSCFELTLKANEIRWYEI